MPNSYSLKIVTDAAGRNKMRKSGMKLVFAKGVTSDSGNSVDYNTAWFVLGADEIAETLTVSWTVQYKGNYSLTEANDGIIIDIAGNDVDLVPGCYYNVDDTSTLEQDTNRGSAGDAAFHFRNDNGYANEYIPVLKAQAKSPTGETQFLPFWTATTGVPHNGKISATPVAKVRVWLGKYEAGAAVLADYSTQPIEFDLTNNFHGQAKLLSDLSGWTNASKNGRTPA